MDTQIKFYLIFIPFGPVRDCGKNPSAAQSVEQNLFIQEDNRAVGDGSRSVHQETSEVSNFNKQSRQQGDKSNSLCSESRQVICENRLQWQVTGGLSGKQCSKVLHHTKDDLA